MILNTIKMLIKFILVYINIDVCISITSKNEFIELFNLGFIEYSILFSSVVLMTFMLLCVSIDIIFDIKNDTIKMIKYIKEKYNKETKK